MNNLVVDGISLEFIKPKNFVGNVLILPGVRGELLSGKYDYLFNELLKNNFSLIKFEIWKKPSDLNKMTMSQILKKINKLIDFVKNDNTKPIFLIGKSFGGTLLLINKRDIRSIVTYAPSFEICNNKDHNLDNLKNIKLSKIKSTTEIKIKKSFFSDFNVPSLIIYGDNDEVISLKKTKDICNSTNSKLSIINGMGHGPENDLDKYFIAKKTIDFFKKNLYKI